MYASAWRAFQSWTRARGILAMPASTSLIAAYLAHLAAVHKLSTSNGLNSEKRSFGRSRASSMARS